MSDKNQAFAIGTLLVITLAGLCVIYRNGGSISISKDDDVFSVNVNPHE